MSKISDFFTDLEVLMRKHDATITSIGHDGSSIVVICKDENIQIDHPNNGGDARLNEEICAGIKYH